MNTCLTCLLKTKKEMYHIDEADAKIIHKIEECGGIKIIKNKQYPNNLCPKCYAALTVAYNFRICCQKSQEVLRQTFVSVLHELEIELDEEEEFLPITENDFKDFDEIVKNVKPFDDKDIIEEDVLKIEDDFITYDEHFLKAENDIEEMHLEVSEQKSSPKKPQNKIIESKPKNPKKPAKSKQKKIKSENKREKSKLKGPFMCHHCGHISTERNCFNAHLKRHLPDDQKAYQCEICQRRFNNSSHMHIHMNTHTGQKPYKCKFCTNAFADPSTLVRHERVHQNIRPYKCDVCQKTFTYSHSLNKHLRIHRGDKPYGCEYCGRRFTESHQKKAHENTHRKHMEKEFLKAET